MAALSSTPKSTIRRELNNKEGDNGMKKEYTVLGTWDVCNFFSLELLDIDYDTDKALTRFGAGGRKAWSSMRVDRYGRDYINRGGSRYYFDQCLAIM